MFLRVVPVILTLSLSGVAYGQSDTVRVRPVPRTVARDSETVEVLRSDGILPRMDPVVRRRMIDTLEAQRRIWNRNRPRTYVIRVFEMSGCLEVRIRPRIAGQLLRDQLIVRDTTIVRRQLVPIPAIYEQRCALAWRVDDLFTDLTRALADSTAGVTHVAYDRAYGFPRAYSVIRGWGSENEYGALVESFAPAPERAPPDKR